MNTLPRPGDLTVPFKGGPIGLYRSFPQDDVLTDIADDSIEGSDGMLFIVSHVGRWCFVMTSTLKVGWVYEFDVGPGSVSGAVYHVV